MDMTSMIAIVMSTIVLSGLSAKWLTHPTKGDQPTRQLNEDVPRRPRGGQGEQAEPYCPAAICTPSRSGHNMTDLYSQQWVKDAEARWSYHNSGVGMHTDAELGISARADDDQRESERAYSTQPIYQPAAHPVYLPSWQQSAPLSLPSGDNGIIDADWRWDESTQSYHLVDRT
jgi:hypothetical protein